MRTVDDDRVKHGIRGTLLAFGAGVVGQRLCQLLTFVLIGTALGAGGLGRYAEGMALAAVLVVLAGAGVRNLTARQLAAAPGSARALVTAAVRMRLRLGALGLLVAAAIAFATSELPWFYVLCALQVLPGAFDQKQIADAAGRARSEVALETTVSALQLAAVLVWSWQPQPDLTTLAALALACRCVYAARAAVAMRNLPATQSAEPLPARPLLLVGQSAHELLTAGDVWLVAVLLGDAAAGFYAFAQRFAAAALVPSTQLARLLLPHLLHASANGDASRTLGTALRAVAFLTLPVAAGGAMASLALCRFFAAGFDPAAAPLCLLLVAGCMQHLGWQCSHALLAQRRDAAYAHGLLWPAALHASCLLALAAVPTAPDLAALLAAAAATFAYTAYWGVGMRLVRPERTASLLAPLALAVATGATTALAGALVPGSAGLALQLAVGAGTLAVGVWWCELRGRWRRFGDGLAQASGFRA